MLTVSPRLFGDVRIVNRPDLENVRRLDMGCMPMLVSMERNGMRVDRTAISALHTRLTGEMEELSSTVTKLTGYNINLGSGDQLSDLLFSRDKLKLKQPGKERWTKSRRRLAADSDVLKSIISQHPAIKPILDWKEREKLRSTYTYSLAAKADENDRIHTDISTTTAETGRITSSAPNLQNIPTRTKLGKEVRGAFIPSPGNVLGTCDASQIEMRVHAHDSQCVNMMDIFWRWDDLYWATAELMYNRKFSPDERKHGMTDRGISYKEWFRFNAKTTTLGVSYDISPAGLLDQFLISGSTGWIEDEIGIPLMEWEEDERGKAISICGRTIVSWFDAYAEILKRRRQHHQRAYRWQLVWDMWGRVRWIPQVRSSLSWITAEGLRQAGNMPIQGAAAGIIKLWMAALWYGWGKWCRGVQHYWSQRGLRMLIQIHDELLVEGPRAVVEDFLAEAAHVLRNLIPVDWFTVPLEAEYAVGEVGGSWAQLEK